MFGSLVSLTVCTLAALTAAAPHVEKRAPTPFSTFTHNPVYYPLEQAPLWRVAYARALQAPDSSLLLTWEDYPAGQSATNLDTFKILRSTDGGATWANLSQVHDTQNGWGMRFQPNMYTLTSSVGSYPAGTVIIGGVSCNQSLDGGVYIDVYASPDSGSTWTFTSHAAYGAGPETVTTGDDAIWEPFFLQYDGLLYMYFSDQRDPQHSQKLSMTATADLVSWQASFDVVTHSDPNARPGMAVVSYIPNIQQYMLTYEYCNSGRPGCPATFRLSADPTKFLQAADHNLTTTDGYQPSGSPYSVFYQYPNSSQGAVVVSTNSDTNLFVSQDYTNTWTSVNVNQWTGQSRHLMLFDDNGSENLHLATGGFYGCSGSCYNYVANGVTDPTVFQDAS